MLSGDVGFYGLERQRFDERMMLAYKRTIQNYMYVSRDHTDWEPSFANLRRSFLSTSLATAGVWPPALSGIPACPPLWRAMRTYITSTSDSVAVRGLNSYFVFYFLHLKFVAIS
jgi:hypothetical protein